MKKKDIFQLALLRIKSRHSIRTFIAMIFGLLMLVEVLWLSFAIDIHLQSQINDTPLSNLFLIQSNAVESVDIRTKQDVNSGLQLTYQQKQSLQTDDEVIWTEVFFAPQSNASYNEELNISIDGQEQTMDSGFKIKFIKNAQTKTHPDAIEEYLIDTYGHGSVYGDKFSDSKRELYISEQMLERLGLSRDEAIGKNVSLSMSCSEEVTSLYHIIDNDTIFENQHIKCEDANANAPVVNGDVKIFTDFRIVGVISREYYRVNKLTSTDCDIWMKDDVLKTDDGGSLFPRISLQDIAESNGSKTQKAVLTYPRVDFVQYSQEVTESGNFFPFFAGGLEYANRYTSRESGNIYIPLCVSYVQCDDFNEAQRLDKRVRECVIENGGGDSTYWASHTSSEFRDFSAISDTMNKVRIAFSIIGGLTLLTVILNYSNVVAFNARKRVDFLSMMKKIGMTEKDKNTLVNMEIFGGFAIVLLISFLLGLIISAIVKAVISKLVFAFNILANIKIALWLYIPAFLIVAVAMTIVMILISINGKSKQLN